MEKELAKKTAAFMLFCAMVSSLVLPMYWVWDDGYGHSTIDLLIEDYGFVTYTDLLLPVSALLGTLLCLFSIRKSVRRASILLMYVPAIIYIFAEDVGLILYGDGLLFRLGIGYFVYVIFVSIALIISKREKIDDEEELKDKTERKDFKNFIKRHKVIIIILLIISVAALIDELLWYLY